MTNYKMKFVKSAAVLALGASVITSAVVAGDLSASAKTTYKVSKGKLVNAKTKKVVKGFKVYKSVLYKDGKKFTGIHSKRYYKAGVKATGTYKGAYYVKGVKKVTTGTYKGVYYKKGVKATGYYKKAYYVKGKKVVDTGIYKEKFYKDGKLNVGLALYQGKLYKDTKLNKDLALFEGKLYKDATLNKDLVKYDDKLYNGAKENKGLIEFEGKFYYDTTLANGTYKDEKGVEKQYKDGVVVDFAVKSVKEITTTTVTVSFDALTEDHEGVELEVTNGKGEAVAVKAINLSKGDKEAQFTFATAQTAETQTGVWTFGTVSYDFDAIKNFDAIVAAANPTTGSYNEVTFYNALTKAGIQNVSDSKLDDYKTAINVAVAATASSTTEQKAEKLADIQTIVDKVNKAEVEATADKAIVKAVADAENNVQLLKVLQEKFARVNADWISHYKDAEVETATGTKISLLNLTKDNFGEVTSKDIQAAIDDVNEGQISDAWDTVWATPSVDNLKVVKGLVQYNAADTDAQKAEKAYYEDELARLEAVINVFTVANSTATNSALEKAIQAADEVENALVAKYKDTAYATKFTNDLVLNTVNSELLTQYRTGLKAAVAGKQNQTKDIQNVITTANNTANASAITEALAKLNTAAKATTPSDKEILAALKAVQNLNTATTKNEIKDASASAYKVAVVAATIDFNLESVNTLIGTVNDEEANKAALASVNGATTVEAVQAALVALVDANSPVVADFSAVATADQKYVAAAVLENRPETTGYASLNDVKTAIENAKKSVDATVSAVNKLTSASTKADVITALTADATGDSATVKKVKDADFEALTTSQKQAKAEAFVNGLVFDSTSLKTNFKSVASIYAQLLK